ncbi:hypothetical protein [Rhizobium leguminosarum]
MKIALKDAPDQWFKAFALAGVDLSQGGEFDATNAENPLERDLDWTKETFKQGEATIQSSHCFICYKGACVYCYEN